MLVIGVGESGKSSLVRKLIEDSGLPAFVFDPILSEWPNAQLITDDMAHFMEECERATGPRIAFVDEAGEALTVGNKQNHRVFTRWRHKAILPIAAAQRYKMIAPNVRVNATDIYLFETAAPDCEELAIDFNCPELLQASSFSAGDFLHYTKINGKKNITKHHWW